MPLVNHKSDKNVHTTITNPHFFTYSKDFIANCDSGTATHSLVVYRAKSGALGRGYT